MQLLTPCECAQDLQVGEDATGTRLLGNLLGTASEAGQIGAAVDSVFASHGHADPPLLLLQWQLRAA